MSTMKNPNSSSSKALFSHIKYEHLVAGISGGVTSTLILHPLDLIKIRFAVNDGRTATVPRYDGLSSAFVTIVKKEGVKGLYRGVTPNVWGSGSAWGFYFLFYNAIKTWIQGGNARTPLGPGLHMLAAAEAGVLSLVMTNPIWVVKTRLCLQYSEEHLADNKRYKGMIDGLMKIYRTEGIRGLYRGFVPGMFGVSHGALQFMTYEEMKNRYNQYRNLPIDIKLVTTSVVKTFMTHAPSGWYVVVEAELVYMLPDHTIISSHLRRKLHHRQKKEIWETLESMFQQRTMNGRACVIRTICEAQQSLAPKGKSLVHDILRAMFTAPLHERDFIEEMGMTYTELLDPDFCEKANACPLSVLGVILDLNRQR